MGHRLFSSVQRIQTDMANKARILDFGIRNARRVAAWIVALTAIATPAQEPDAAAIIRKVDEAVANRFENVLSYTATERYAVFRGDDEVHPAAEMTVRDTYKKGVGKAYDILSQSGSSVILRFGLKPLLDNEKTINLPGNVEKSWFDSANYEMQLKPGGIVQLNGRGCYVLAVTAKRAAPNTINGTLWVDARDGTIVQLDGIATASASAFSGPAHMMRQYTNLSGFAMATHARAESRGALIGRNVITIDYSDYQLHLKPSQ
jgi:outer membrane lipoprotein-sorting protein